MLIAVTVLAVLAAGLAVAAFLLLDLACVGLAERKAADVLSAPFGHRAGVRVRSTPFLSQAVRGRYREVVLGGGGLRLGEITGVSLDATLHNSYLPLRDLIGRRVQELACERVEGVLVLPYGELARVSRIPGLELRLDSGGGLRASAALPIPGITQLARVSGQAVLTLGGGSSVWLKVTGVSVAGISVPSLVLNQLLPTLNVRIPLPELPYGLRLDALTPTPDGLAVSGSAEAVVFRARPAAAAQPGVGGAPAARPDPNR
jgi:hypothetical protein